jgi:plastocyanin
MFKTIKRFGFFLLVLAGAVLVIPVTGDAAPSGGTLEGTLTVTAAPRVSAPAGETGGSQPFYDGGENESGVVRHSPPEEVVVYLEDVPGSYPPPKEHVRLDQKFLQFTHRVLPVLRGTVVDFTNHDPVYHNVFSNSQVNKFDLGRKGRGEKSSVKMLHSEIPVKVYCEIHADMKSNILVLDNPFFTSVKPGEKFKIAGIPPGTYHLVAWHDYWEPVEQKVTIEEGGTTQADVTLSQVQK